MADAPVVIRRRAGSSVDVRRQGDATQHLLETGGYRPMRQRVLEAARNLEAALTQNTWAIPFQEIEEREEQREALNGFLEYMQAVASGLATKSLDPVMRGRLVAAARIGKTEMMIMLICAMGARAVICVPSVALVEQTIARLRAKAPSLTVGAYYGDAKNIVNNGVTVVTYQTLTAHAKAGTLPASIRDVTLVFCDEGHETMTENRQDSIGITFDPQAVVVAFSATPDYDCNKVLAVFYPYLIFELLMPEASTRGLLAPARFGYRIVDCDASKVTIRNGNYDERELDEVTANALVYEEARSVRYDLSSTDVSGREIAHHTLGTLITCNSKTQAKGLHNYLAEHRPKGTPCPALVLDDTSPDRRREIIRDFDAGRIDTLIIVRTLLRGWNAPRCKLLIDLSPSRSRVLSGQKFPRPLTKVGDQTGFIFVIYPYGLRPIPMLPSDILAVSFTGDDDEQRLKIRLERGRNKAKAVLPMSDDRAATRTTKKKLRIRDVKVDKVALRHVAMFTLKPPTFKPDVIEEVRSVVLTSWEFVAAMRNGRQPSRADFREFIFEHDTFVGNGVALLRYCRLAPGTINFRKWLAKYFPEFKVLEEGDPEVEYDAETGEATIVTIEYPGDVDVFYDPDDELELRVAALELWRKVFGENNYFGLSERQRFVLTERLEGNSWADIGELIGITGAWASTNAARTMGNIRDVLKIHVREPWKHGLD